MALALQDSQLVWAKVIKALETQVVGTAGTGCNPAAQAAFKGLKQYLVEQGGNPQLQFVPFSEANMDANGGTPIVDAPCTLYGIYIRKNTSATDAYVKLYDDVTDDTTAGDQIIAIPLMVENQDAFEIHPRGQAFPTGIVVTEHTTSIGVSDASEGGDGFILIGAA